MVSCNFFDCSISQWKLHLLVKQILHLTVTKYMLQFLQVSFLLAVFEVFPHHPFELEFLNKLAAIRVARFESLCE
jgi:hypothetical protein